MVDFKLHLSSKSLCWQSGFVTWEEGDMAELKLPEPPLDIPRAPPRVPEPRTWAPPQHNGRRMAATTTSGPERRPSTIEGLDCRLISQMV